MIDEVRKEFTSRAAPWTEPELKNFKPRLNNFLHPHHESNPSHSRFAHFLATLAQAEDFDLKASIDRGKVIYMQTCFVCHQPTGLGLPGAFPPLAGTEYTQGDARRMIAMTLKGVNPPLKVKAMTYVVPMPPLPTQFPILVDDGKLADVINYVRNSLATRTRRA